MLNLLMSMSPAKSAVRVAGVVREVAVQPLGVALGTERHCVDEQVAADERAFPRLADSAEHLVAVAAAARLVDARP